jgi:hypothetical protein
VLIVKSKSRKANTIVMASDSVHAVGLVKVQGGARFTVKMKTTGKNGWHQTERAGRSKEGI